MAGTYDIAKRAGIDGDLAQRFIDAVVEAICEGDRVALRGLGSFQLRTLPARTYDTPVMKQAVTKPERDTIGFKPSAWTVDKLNS